MEKKKGLKIDYKYHNQFPDETLVAVTIRVAKGTPSRDFITNPGIRSALERGKLPIRIC